MKNFNEMYFTWRIETNFAVLIQIYFKFFYILRDSFSHINLILYIGLNINLLSS